MRRPISTGLLAVVLLAACADGGVDDVDEVGDARDAADAEVAPLPELPDPTPARPCDVPAVLCVDASADGGGDGSAEAPFRTIGDAVAAAGAGAVVQVAGGEYEEAVLVDEVDGLALVGGFPAGGDFAGRDPGANPTVVRGDAAHAVVTVVASTDVRIEGFRLTGGGGFDDGFNVEGGGIYVDGGSSGVAIVANQVVGNAIDHGPQPDNTRGGGISTLGTDIEIVGNVIEGNRGGRGAGIAVTGGATIDGNRVLDNHAVGDHGGGLWLTGRLVVTRNHVEGNSIGTDVGYGWGGGIIVFGAEADATLQGNVVTGNLAVSYGSGVFIDDGAHATITGDLYYGNECPQEGGAGLFVDSGGGRATTVEVRAVTIAEHDCPDVAQGGNGVYVGRSDATTEDQPVVTVADSILWHNSPSDTFVADAQLTVTGTLTEAPVDGEGNTTGDPRFADPAGGDFTPDPSGPGAGLGATGA